MAGKHKLRRTSGISIAKWSGPAEYATEGGGSGEEGNLPDETQQSVF